MKLIKIGFLYNNIENDKFVIHNKEELVLIDKIKNYRIMYDDDDTILLYENSITKKVFGDVLIVGLGYGLIHYNFNLLEDVNSITTIEIEKGIIDLVKPILPFINFINADALTFESNKIYDYILLDIFSDIVVDYEFKQNNLLNKYTKMVNKDNIDYLKIHNIDVTKNKIII